ncbi:MAG: LysR family transcriptional regulator [Saccharospirillaceae bacterium]|nr:LysR family transcriptional regulator [Pseudomonadales bacterium]NRB80083.1 LysR family transcriptional regulator [Saccharospirillaceae bacterium]
MEINSLEAFVAVADNQSFSQAAEKLFITQPAISKRISVLERSLDSKLFDRMGRNILLTEAGQALMPIARKILQDIIEARRNVQNISGLASGELKIASSHHVGLHYLPPIIKRFGSEFSQVTLNIQFINSEQAIESIMNQNIELAFTTLPNRLDAQLTKQKVWKDSLHFVCASDHVLSQKKQLMLNELQYFPAILPEEHSTTFKIIESEFSKHHLPLKSAMTVNFLETIKMLVAAGLGWSVLPSSMIDDSLKILPIKLELNRELGWIRHKHRSLSNAGKALIGMIENRL